jgi:hypothetical protein
VNVGAKGWREKCRIAKIIEFDKILSRNIYKIFSPRREKQPKYNHPS